MRERSVVEITSPVAFDPVTNTPLPGGLYDARMGPIPGMGGGSQQQQSSCITCGRLVHDCTGHCGHLELVVPIYHPILLSDLLIVCQCICRNCFQFRCPKQQLQIMQLKFYLLQQEDEEDTRSAVSSSSLSQLSNVNYHTIDTILAAAMYEAREQYPNSKVASTRAATEAIAQIIQSIVTTNNNATATNNATSTTSSSYVQQLRSELCKTSIQYLQSIPKCHHCGIYSPKLRIDSFNKIFQVPLSKKYQQYNQQLSKTGTYTFPSASRSDHDATSASNTTTTNTTTTYDSDDTEMLEEEDDNDDDDNEDGGNDEATEKTPNTNIDIEDDDTTSASANTKNAKGKQRDMYIPPTEILALVRRIYERDSELCRNIFSIANYEQYFLYCIAVLPNRFRPPMKVGGNDNMVEHVQTSFYQQILQHNATLRDQIASISTTTEHNNNNRGANHMTNSAYQTWIELQTAVNCYMDSSKDPKKTASMNVASGIRQILERKEGLFRKHMMGKRVNYACRSVISPDPYIGSNEIGLPKYFCTILTYPTYVTPMNVVALRNAVLRGPHHYPGARWVQLSSSSSAMPTKIDLSKMKFHQRQSIAAQLLGNNSRGPPTIVGRQLQDGDYVLMNRQVRVWGVCIVTMTLE